MLHSEGHADRTDWAKTAAASEAKTKRRQNKHKLSKIEVAGIIIKHKIVNLRKLLWLATQCRSFYGLQLWCVRPVPVLHRDPQRC